MRLRLALAALAVLLLPSGVAAQEQTPEPTLVGDFLCLDLATARIQLEEAGLLIGAVIPDPALLAENWIIHDQGPKSGESVPIGYAVDLVLKDPLEPCPEEEVGFAIRGERGTQVGSLVEVALALLGIYREQGTPEVVGPPTRYAVPAIGTPGREAWTRTVDGLGVILYEVQEDEKLLKIGETFGVSRRKIIRSNEGMAEMIPFVDPGDIILVPVSPDVSEEDITALPGFIGTLTLTSPRIQAAPTPPAAESPTPS